MNFQFEIAQAPEGAAHSAPPADATDLLRQLLEVQREQLALFRASQDASARWRSVLAKWQGDFDGLPEACKNILPTLERTYIDLVVDMTSQLREQNDSLNNEFALAEFLDRYGVRLGQLATLLSVVGPLAEVATQDTGTSSSK